MKATNPGISLRARLPIVHLDYRDAAVIRASAPTAAVPGEVDLVTVPNIEILEVGEEWQLSSGPCDFTPEHLISCIASQDDPAVRTPVVKLGHVDPRFDGQPTFGRWENLRLINDGMTLVGDAVGVPRWLAACMYAAYPRRSIEGAFNIETKTGNVWPLVLTGVSLLGDAYPGVETLEDLKLLWGSAPPPLYPVYDVDELAASGPRFRGMKETDLSAGSWLSRKKKDDEPTSVAAAAQASVAASTSLDDVRQAFYAQLGPAQSWWWIREIQVNPLSLIVDDDEGNLWQIPVTVSANDEVTFGDPSQVKVEYVAAGSHRMRGQLLAASFGSPEETGRSHKPEDSSADPSTNPENAPSATVTPAQASTDPEVHSMNWRSLLGLPETATDAEVEAEMAKRLTPQATTPEETPAPDNDGNPQSQPNLPATDPAAQPATATPTGTPNPDPAAPPVETPAAPSQLQVPEGMKLVDAATLEQMQAGIAASTQLVERERQREQDAILDSAIRAGKFAPSRRPHYATMLTADPEGTRTLLASMAENLIPVKERGELTGEENPKTEESAYPATWNRHVKAAQRGISKAVKVVQD